MPDITFKTQPAPTIPEHVKEELESMSPRVFLRWNPRWQKQRTVAEQPVYEGRWEIWCEVADTAHPDANNTKAEGDVYNHEAGCWMRKLQTYKHADGSFAPADQRLIVGLRMADAWNNDEFYEEHFQSHEERQQAVRDKLREGVEDSHRYYDGLDRTLVGPHTRGNWRHRIR